MEVIPDNGSALELPVPPKRIGGVCPICEEYNLREAIRYERDFPYTGAAVRKTFIVRRVICWCCGWMEEIRTVNGVKK